MDERRELHRERVDLIATVVIDEGISRVDSIVFDMTRTGARLTVHPNRTLPQEFYMLLPNHQMQQCRIIWRDGANIGVQFND